MLTLMKKIVVGLMVLTVLWFLYNFSTRLLKSFTKGQPKTLAAEFNANDAVNYVPQLGLVQELKSDKTVDAILSGAYGPHVVMVYAEWCSHCKNMMDAYDAAAKSGSIPFIRIQGSNAPVTSAKHSIAGYPTVLGSSSSGGPKRFASVRTPEALLDFANSLSPAALGPSLLGPSLLGPSLDAASLGPSLGQPVAPLRPTIQGAMNSFLKYNGEQLVKPIDAIRPVEIPPKIEVVETAAAS